MINNFDEEEKKILQSFEENEWISDPDLEQRKRMLKETAKYTTQKNRRVNIRMSERDVIEIKKHAVEEGLPYQTLISHILHKYINGRLVAR